jgi:hypothetical protein
MKFAIRIIILFCIRGGNSSLEMAVSLLKPALTTFNPFDKDRLCREVLDVLFHATRIASMVYLLKKIYEVAEEYGISVAYMEEAYTSSSCPIHGGMWEED